MKSDELLSEYLKAAVNHGLATQRCDDKAANKQYAILKRIYDRMQKEMDLKENIISSAFKSQNPSVLVWAAAHSLGLKYNINQAISILNKLSQDKNIGIQSFNAKMTLESYKNQGFLKF